MIGPWLPPSRQDIMAIALGLALLVILIIGAFFVPVGWKQPTNAGFGPEWICNQEVTRGGPVCIKRPPAEPPVGSRPSQ
jgi:hypothetical protein